MNLLSYLLTGMLLPACAVVLLAALYYHFLLWYSLWRRSRAAADLPPSMGAERLHSFAILVPACNEAQVVRQAIQSCLAQQYPRDRCAVYVVADNCSDRTATVAHAAGANVLIRSDPEKRGKCYAVEWGLRQIAGPRHDAVVILDADCSLSENALPTFNAHLCRGDQALQCCYVFEPVPGRTTDGHVPLASRMEDHLYFAPKSALGLSVFLRGTGMVLARAVLEATPWSARTNVEDTEYSLELIRKGTRIVFVESVQVTSAAPEGLDELLQQRTRWIGGNIRLALRAGPRLLWEGLRRGDRTMMDAGLALFLGMRTLLLVGNLMLLVAALGASLLLGSVGCWTALGLSLFALVLQAAYYLAGMALCGERKGAGTLALASPSLLAYFFRVAARSLFCYRAQWLLSRRGSASGGG